MAPGQAGGDPGVHQRLGDQEHVGGPDPDRPVTASSIDSGTRTTVPTAPRIDSAQVEVGLGGAGAAAMAAAPAPTRAGVLGMARTTARAGAGAPLPGRRW